MKSDNISKLLGVRQLCYIQGVIERQLKKRDFPVGVIQCAENENKEIIFETQTFKISPMQKSVRIVNGSTEVEPGEDNNEGDVEKFKQVTIQLFAEYTGFDDKPAKTFLFSITFKIYEGDDKGVWKTQLISGPNPDDKRGVV